ncbi:MAG: hypothetical protein AAGB00_12350, partial [Planctomycetota bacterium]
SQIIAVEALSEDEADEDSLLGGAALAAAPGAAAASAPAMVPQAEFSVWNVIGLGACFSVMLVCGIMMVDIVRSIWAWEEPNSTSSALINGLLETFGR